MIISQPPAPCARFVLHTSLAVFRVVSSMVADVFITGRAETHSSAQLTTSAVEAQIENILRKALTMTCPVPALCRKSTEVLAAGYLLVPHCLAGGHCVVLSYTLPVLVRDGVDGSKHPEEEGCCVGQQGEAGARQDAQLTRSKLTNTFDQGLVIGQAYW